MPCADLAPQHAHDLATGHVPDPHGFVVGGRVKQTAIRAEHKFLDNRHVPAGVDHQAEISIWAEAVKEIKSRASRSGIGERRRMVFPLWVSRRGWIFHGSIALF